MVPVVVLPPSALLSSKTRTGLITKLPTCAPVVRIHAASSTQLVPRPIPTLRAHTSTPLATSERTFLLVARHGRAHTVVVCPRRIRPCSAAKAVS